MQRIVMALSLTLVPIVVLMHVRGRAWWEIGKQGIPGSISAFLLLGLGSALTAYSVRHALYEWASLLLLFGLAWVIAKEIQTSKGQLLNAVLVICGLGCALYLFKVIILYALSWLGNEQPIASTFIFGFDNLRFFNHMQTVSLPILALLVMQSRRFSKMYWFWFVTVSLWWTMLLVSGGRGTFMGVMAGGAITWFLRRKFASNWCRLLVYTFLAGGVVYLLFFTFIPLLCGLKPFGYSVDAGQTVQHLRANPTNNRAALWQVAWQMIITHPWLGAGPLHFAHYTKDSVGDAAHPHNWVLQIASEWGIPALICLITAVSLTYRTLLHTGSNIHSEDRVNQATLCAWLTIGAAILVDGLVSGLIVMPVSQLWIALFIGCAWGWTSIVTPVEAEPIRFGRFKFAILVLLFAATVLLWRGLYPEITNIPEFEANALNSGLYRHQQFRPRIWLAGYF